MCFLVKDRLLPVDAAMGTTTAAAYVCLGSARKELSIVRFIALGFTLRRDLVKHEAARLLILTWIPGIAFAGRLSGVEFPLRRVAAAPRFPVLRALLCINIQTRLRAQSRRD